MHTHSWSPIQNRFAAILAAVHILAVVHILADVHSLAAVHILTAVHILARIIRPASLQNKLPGEAGRMS